jgi:CHAD domain-containing protein
MEKSFVAYVREQVKQFRKNFIKSTSRKNFNEIHDYRVALKRLRTLINFIKKVPGVKDLSNCYKINNLKLAFKAGGILRETQINKIILSKYEHKNHIQYPGFRKYLTQIGKKAFKELQYARSKFSATKLKKFEKKLIGAIDKVPSSLFIKHIDLFIEKRIDQIQKMVTDKNVESSLHRIRRQTKSIKYLLEMSKFGSRSYGNLKFEIDKITKLEDLIGDWHDQQVFKMQLDSYASKFRKRKEIDSDTLKLIKRVDKDYKQIFQQTVKAVYDHYKIPPPEFNK